MVRVPSIPKRKPDLLDEVERLVGPAVEVELEDQTWSRHFLDELDRNADELAKQKCATAQAPRSQRPSSAVVLRKGRSTAL